jgi:hypothetical protein
MPVVVTAADRASFTRCRRQWDFGAALRQNLERRQTPTLPDLDRAVRDALAVYYFPGMWDWDRTVRLPLVGQELARALTRQRQRHRERQQQRGAADSSADDENWQEALGRGQALLDRYMAWAPNADRFAPVLVETDFEVDVLDPVRPDAALVTSVGDIIRYSGRVDMLAVDAHDAYWIVRHRVADGDWPPTEQLVADEESLAACWAWEQFYLGMAIAGTIYNELRSSSTPEREPEQPAPPPPPEGRPRRWPWPRPRTAAALPAVRQHEPSGGGRSVPQHRRMYARAREPRQFKPIEQHTEDGFRRTLLRRSPADVAEAGRRLGADVADMIREDLDVYPEPSDDKCPPCPYLAPCQALMNGTDAEPILLAGYRKRPPEPPAEGRLGGRAWSLGRGAAPPKFSRHPRPG